MDALKKSKLLDGSILCYNVISLQTSIVLQSSKTFLDTRHHKNTHYHSSCDHTNDINSGFMSGWISNSLVKTDLEANLVCKAYATDTFSN